jgi:hypothetical protein
VEQGKGFSFLFSEKKVLATGSCDTFVPLQSVASLTDENKRNRVI